MYNYGNDTCIFTESITGSLYLINNQLETLEVTTNMDISIYGPCVSRTTNSLVSSCCL